MTRGTFIRRIVLAAAGITLAAKLRIDPTTPETPQPRLPEEWANRYLWTQQALYGNAMAIRSAKGELNPLVLDENGHQVGKIVEVDSEGRVKIELLDNEEAKQIRLAMEVGHRLSGIHTYSFRHQSTTGRATKFS